MITKTETSYLHITKPEQLTFLLMDLEQYKKAFSGKRMKLALDLETYFTDEYYREVMSRYARKPVPMPIRISKDEWEGKVRLLSIGLDPLIANRQYLLDVKALGEELITEKFKHILENEAILIGQNLAYDLSFLALQFGIYCSTVRDTMLIGQVRWTGDKLLNDNSEASFNLAALYSRCIPEGLFIELTGMDSRSYERYKEKNQSSDWSGNLDNNQLNYAADDVRLIFYVYSSLLEECSGFKKRYKQSGIVENIQVECEACLEYSLMGAVGIGYDTDFVKNELTPYLEKKAQDAEDILVRVPKCWIEVQGPLKCPKKNPHYEPKTVFADFNSSQQTARVLEENLGFTLPRTSKDNPTIAGDIINELYWEAEEGPAKDILELIIQYREAHSLLSKAGEKTLKYVHDNGRVHPRAFQRGSEEGSIDTGRSCFKDPALQTIPNIGVMDFPGYETDNPKKKFKPFRQAYVAKHDYLGRPHRLVVADFSNEEVRVIGKYTKDEVIIKTFNENGDLHRITADNLGVDRDTGKLFFLSTQYGAYEKRILRSIYYDSGGKFKRTLSEVKELRIKHFELYSGLAAAFRECEEHVEKMLSPYQSLTEFRGRREMLVDFTPTFRAHRIWCLTKDLELQAWDIIKNKKTDILRRDIKVLNPNTGKTSTFGNAFNKRKGEIIRELFNFRVQGDCAVVLKKAVIAIGKAFRSRGWTPYDACVVIVNHDEIVADVREDLVKEVTKIIHDSMYNALYLILGKTIPTVIDIKSGLTWGEAKGA